MLGAGEAAVREFRQVFEQFCSSVEIWEMPVRWKSPEWWARLAVSPLRRAPYNCLSFWSPDLAEKWRLTLERHRGAILHFDSPDLALFAPAAADFRRVLNHHNCESAMAFRRAEQEPGVLRKLYLRREAEKMARVESELCPQFNVNTVVSENDADLLRANSPEAHFHVVENGTDTEYFVPDNSQESDDWIVFAGHLGWYPNVAGIRRFVREAWPLVSAALPNVRLMLAGRDPAPEVLRLPGVYPAIAVVADPEDIRPLVARAAVFVCPIYDGGGTRLKILDALAMGKAVVSTTIGYEGLDVEPGRNILAADSGEEFREQISRALRDRSLRGELGRAGRALVEARYGWKAIAERLLEAYACASNDRACPLRTN